MLGGCGLTKPVPGLYACPYKFRVQDTMEHSVNDDCDTLIRHTYDGNHERVMRFLQNMWVFTEYAFGYENLHQDIPIINCTLRNCLKVLLDYWATTKEECFLVSRSRDDTSGSINARNSDGQTAVHIAVQTMRLIFHFGPTLSSHA